MSTRNREKNLSLKNEIFRLKTVIALKCYDCQGYELSTTALPECYNCPLAPFCPRKGSTKNPVFAALVKKMRNGISGEVAVDKDFWKNEFEKLNFSFRKKDLKS